MAEFPHERWQRVGATADERAQLADEFDHSDVLAQESLVASWASVSDGDLEYQIATLRDQGHFDKEPAAPEAQETDIEPPESPPVVIAGAQAAGVRVGGRNAVEAVPGDVAEHDEE